MRIFVTGGSGFIGGHVLEQLSKQHDVRAMARSASSAKVVQGFGATPVTCDLDGVTPAALEGCDAVIHCAAFVGEWGTRADYWKGNVDGTTRMLDVAKQAGVKRFLHVGTEAALFDGQDLIDVDETYPIPKRHRFLYPETKAEAERRVLAASAPGFDALSIRPRLVWGPRDATVLPVILKMAKAGTFKWVDGGRHRSSTTHVLNLVHALSLALEKGRGGQAYFVADDGTRTVREFLTALAQTQGVTLPDSAVPGWLARALAGVVELPWRVLGLSGAPPMTRFAVTMMSASVTVRCDKAKAELGYAPVLTVDEGLAQLRAPA